MNNEQNFLTQVTNYNNKKYDLHDIRITDEKIKQIENNGNAYSSIKQLDDYLFETQYTTANIDYDYANQYFQNTNESIGAGGCSGVIKDGKVLRQLDWTYDSNVEFIVRRVADEEKGIYGSLGMCSGIRGMTKDFVESGKFSEKYKIVPFIVTDGINDQGLYIQSNVVPKTYNDGTTVNYNLNPTSTNKCCITMAIRYILDHCKDFNDINEFFTTYNIYSPSPLVVEYGYHFLVAKGNEYGIIELTNSGFTILRESDLNFPVMTNFRLASGIVSEDRDVDWNQIEQLGIGVERFEIALTAFDGVSLEALREQLAYTNWYTGDGQVWPTEFTGSTAQLISGGQAVVTVQGVKQGLYDLTPLYLQEKENYSERTREDGKGTWQTVHSSIYDLSSKELNLAIQERMNEEKKISFKGDKSDLFLDKVVKIVPNSGSQLVIERNGIAETYEEKWFYDEPINKYNFFVKEVYKPNSNISYKYQSGDEYYIYGFDYDEEDCDIAQLKDETTVINGTMKIFNKEGTSEITDDSEYLGSGMIIRIFDSSNTVIEEFRYILFGDVNGDANIDSLDAQKVSSYIWNRDSYPLNNWQFRAADVNQSGSIDLEDCRLIRAVMSRIFTDYSAGRFYLPKEYYKETKLCQSRTNTLMIERNGIVETSDEGYNGDIPFGVYSIIDYDPCKFYEPQNSGSKYYMYGLEQGSTIADLKASLYVRFGAFSVYANDGTTQLADSDIVRTGIKIISKRDGNIIETFTYIVFGDIGGDGQIEADDALLVESFLAGTTLFTPVQFKAADLMQVGQITKIDATHIIDTEQMSGTINQQSGRYVPNPEPENIV